MKSKHSRIWKTWRTKNLLSQANLALVLGITDRTIRNIESGRVAPSYTSQMRFNEVVARYRKNRRVR